MQAGRCPAGHPPDLQAILPELPPEANLGIVNFNGLELARGFFLKRFLDFVKRAPGPRPRHVAGAKVVDLLAALAKRELDLTNVARELG